MRSSRFHPLAFVFLGAFLSATTAAAGPKEEVAAATQKWADTLAENKPESILPLYAEDAVLWGTLASTVRTDRAGMRDYFVSAFAALPNLKVALGEQVIRVYGDAAVNTGNYTFSYVKVGEPKTLPARYSFTYVKKADGWIIVDHHSSAMPQPPK
ncbi:SgcJ/EcaC family oxidoreductase [Microvirga yunnanensis]|nr:SgcJ/EcaC family oxidoreductase [Microvirga sp. HBU67655]